MRFLSFRRAVLAVGFLLTSPLAGGIAASPVVVDATSAQTGGAGILLLAHGGSADWNDRVLTLAAKVNETRPVEVAFGMATRRNLQAAVDRLAARGVSKIVAVPLFVSSWSSVVTASEFLLGLRKEAPPALAVFAKMAHSDPTAGASNAAHIGIHDDGLAMTPVVSRIPILRMSPALNAHPLVAEILIDRAKVISRNAAAEAVVIVAHGPNSDDENRRWLDDMAAIAQAMKRNTAFVSIEYLTVRDDAPAAIRDTATAELRALVSRQLDHGHRVLVVPLLLSFGGVEKGIVARLEGLTVTLATQALLPDDRLVAWVLEMGT